MPNLSVWISDKKKQLTRSGAVQVTCWDHEKGEPYLMMLSESVFQDIMSKVKDREKGNLTRKGTWL